MRTQTRLRWFPVFAAVAIFGISSSIAQVDPPEQKHLQAFEAAKTTGEKLNRLADLEKHIEDAELPREAAWLLALKLIKPHLTWHAAYPPPLRPEQPDLGYRHKQLEELYKEYLPRTSMWHEAHPGEAWMLNREPRKQLKQALKIANERREKKDQAEQTVSYFWRLSDPSVPDVIRARKLLKQIKSGNLGAKARRLLAEIDRNNTVATMEVAGSYTPDKSGQVILDVRNAEQLELKLYRAENAANLLAVLGRIGEHFIFRDYALQYEQLRQLEQLQDSLMHREEMEWLDENKEAVILKQENLVHSWNTEVKDLRVLDLTRENRRYSYHDYDEDYLPDGDFFGDFDRRYLPRLRKSYWPGWHKVSSWQCDRLLSIPAGALQKPGGYILEVEANGQKYFAPIIVDSLSMLLRRCRDGVFALVNEAENGEPIGGAKLTANHAIEDVVTDENGVGFLKVHAVGHRAVLAQKGERYAIGGFGEVFEGIYHTESDIRSREFGMREVRLRRLMEQAQLAHAYIDRYLAAAFTDRPTYRPGQKVQFKLVVRKIGKSKDEAKAPKSTQFRATDFDWEGLLVPPGDDEIVGYDVIDPKGRIVTGGDLKLNDFGTSAGEFVLSAESGHGTYSLRISAGGMDRIVPGVFSVSHYRRPNFEIMMKGVPDAVDPGDTFTLKLQGDYYFGRPVSNGACQIQLLTSRGMLAVSESRIQLNDKGAGSIEMRVPDQLASGDYRIYASLTDPGGRTVTEAKTIQVNGGHPSSPLSEIPLYTKVGDALTIHSDLPGLVAEQESEGKRLVLSPTRNKQGLQLKLSSPGWWQLRSGKEKVDVFAYGGSKSPYRVAQRINELNDDTKSMLPRWVNLTDYEREEDGWYRYSHSGVRNLDLVALFDGRSVNVGETLPVLVYLPGGGGRVLLTVEGRTVVDYHLFDLPINKENAYHVVELPIKRRYLPNFYLQGKILSGSESSSSLSGDVQVEHDMDEAEEINDGSEDPLWCRVDVVDPKKRPSAAQLKIHIQTDAKKYRPGDQVTARITSTDLTGKPMPAEVSLAVVDESIYSFGEDHLDSLPDFFSDPHPARRFLRKAWRDGGLLHQRRQDSAALMIEREQLRQMAKAMQMEMAESQSALESLSDVAGTPMLTNPAIGLASVAGMFPASSFPLARLRQDFRETAAWLPQLRTDSQGKVETTFTLPDNLTRYRLSSVGLTRDTKLGVGRAELRASLPLSVQLMLPRFAIEGDRLRIGGLIHNHSAKAKKTTVVWEIEGEAKLVNKNQALPGVHKQEIEVEPGESAKVELPVLFASYGKAKVSLRVGAGKQADAEVREISIKPLGKPREFALTGGVTGNSLIEMPSGYAPTDLHLSISQSHLANSLEGLGYLINYPNGCVEQTMSRFLPAVTVKSATQNSRVSLPPEIEEKLPEVLKRGLERLYNFQKENGSWGWWSKDRPNDAMTAYVLYGLARCQRTGTEVDDSVINKASSFLRKRLKSGEMKEEIRPEAWLALTVAGEHKKKAFKKDLETFMAREDLSGREASFLAWACHFGDIEAPAGLIETVTKWKTEATTEIALKLGAQLYLEAPLEICQATAARLLSKRVGPRWSNTRSTSWSIAALSQMLERDSSPSKNTQLKVTLAGKTVLHLNANELNKSSITRLRLTGNQLPKMNNKQASIPLKIEVTGDDPVVFALSSKGIQRMDRSAPEGDKIRMLRKLETTSGGPFSDPAGTGDVVAVRLRVEMEEDQRYVMIDEPRPAGLEFADEYIEGNASNLVVHHEFRDDSLALFFTNLPAGVHEIVYYLRAETPGLSHFLPGECYPMYRETIRGSTGAASIEID